MKSLYVQVCDAPARPVPRGAGGLKLCAHRDKVSQEQSRPARGGWIEITEYPDIWIPDEVPSREGRVD